MAEETHESAFRTPIFSFEQNNNENKQGVQKERCVCKKKKNHAETLPVEHDWNKNGYTTERKICVPKTIYNRKQDLYGFYNRM